MSKKLVVRATEITLVFMAFAVIAYTVYSAVQFGLIGFEYNIGEAVTMTPETVTIPLGSIAFEDTATVVSSDKADVTVLIQTDIDVTLAGFTGFTAFSCTVELKQGVDIKYSVTVTNVTPTTTISSVATGTYDLFIGYSYTAGTSPASGTVTVTFTY